MDVRQYDDTQGSRYRHNLLVASSEVVRRQRSRKATMTAFFPTTLDPTPSCFPSRVF